ncbi:ankyrin repeat domain-containing protein [Nonomuraea sp. NPDC050540]|uniref:ankyrin repeat domain-containing protein n=1 Tax=Nonomuraea sp. NPDC050540 TaxID=3364367 RepID=UPI0037ACD92B
MSADWSGMGGDAWSDLGTVRARLAAGASPDADARHGRTALWIAAEAGSPEVVAELAARSADVDAEVDGRTALWCAVYAGRADNARALAEAGANPWRPMMNGWPPGRLALAGPTPGLFPRPDGEPGLTDEESAFVSRAGSVVAALADFKDDGHSIACMAGIDAAEAMRRLDATPATEEEIEEIFEDPFDDMEESLRFVGVTDVPGGCVVAQPWGYAPFTTGVQKALSAGTSCYGLYSNPASGNQGSAAVDGAVVEWDTHPGGGQVEESEPAETILLKYLLQGHAEAETFARAGLLPPDSRAITVEPDLWLKLPDGDLWA